MELEYIYSKLCWYDKRHPDYDEQENEGTKPRVNCFCDNCFYGRDELALEILKTRPKGAIN
jgi:hypothetical protein